MSPVFGVAVYFMLWWIILFAILPFGLHKTQEEAGEVTPGSEPSAPDRPRFLKVIVATTIITTVVFSGFLYARQSGYGLDDIPFFKPPSQSYSQPSG
ncbi:MAG: DUF1467 family protein [Roseibium sp.]|uniref:DUF1467 family protein n=1 Tax=Roseibium sp. TaxID=1936156 RepID=UPI0026130D4D|nr:DUF1467 family protein [Roseibium sp.]MCV0424834.1 DUF1467 family protein [Roseibium sp.]